MARAETSTIKPQRAERQVVAIRQHRDLFEVQTADGRTMAILAVNLHFKVDSSDRGPAVGGPVILPSGMKGDRATVFFASPKEISALES